MTLPNFLVIGAPKAGTTSLYEHLRAHPGIYMPRLKEPRFFGYDGGEERLRFPIHTLAEYEALFDAVTDETAIGEASPHYLVYPRAAERIRALIPQARLIASLRNPVDRAYSLYQMNMRERGSYRGLSFLQAIHADPSLTETVAEKLERYLGLFPREQIRIILLDDLERAPRATMQELYGFLGVDPGFEPDLDKIANPGGEPRIKLIHDLLGRQRLRVVGRSVLPQSVIYRLKDLRSRNLRKTALPAADRRTAARFFHDDVARTQDLIGRDLSPWLAA
jgi:hypothetical protein